MTDGGEQGVLIAGLIVLLAALLWFPDWSGTWDTLKQMIRIQIGIPR